MSEVVFDIVRHNICNDLRKSTSKIWSAL